MKTNKRIDGFMWFFLIFLCIGIPSWVHADLADILLHFQPYIIVKEEYTDNLFLHQTHAVSDSITTLSPGLRFSTSERSETTGKPQKASTSTETQFGIDVDYHPGFVFYANNSTLNYVSQYLKGNTWLTLDPKLTFKAAEYFNRSQEPREMNFETGALPDESLIGTQRDRSIYWRNVFEPSMAYQFGPEDFINFYYRMNIYRDESFSSRDSLENYLNPQLTYWFDIRNGILLEYGLTLGDFKSHPDLTGHMAKGRYTYRFDPNTSIFGEYIYLKRAFRSPGIDYDVYNPSLGFTYAFNPTLSLKFKAGYYWEVPAKGSTDNGPTFDITFTQSAERTTYTLAFRGGYKEIFFQAENLQFIKYYGVIGSINHHLAERWTVGPSGSLEWIKTREAQEDVIWAIHGNMSYQIFKWLVASLKLTHRGDRSTVSTRGYSENRGMIQLTATYY